MGWFDKLKEGLRKTAEKITGGVRSVIPVGRKLDPQTLDDLEDILITSDLGTRLSASLRQTVELKYRRKEVSETDIESILKLLNSELKHMMPSKECDALMASSGPTVILVVGVNGVGKTTSIAKLAKLHKDSGRNVIIAAADTFRAAATEQLGIWAERAGVEMVRHEHGGDPAAVVHDAAEAALAKNADVLIIDTAGRLHTKANLMKQLEKIRRVADRKIPGAPHEVLLVLDATTGQNAIVQAKAFTEGVGGTGVTGLFLAKLDGTAKGGVVVAIWSEVKIPVKYVGVGETLDDIAPFDPGSFVDALLS